MSNQIIKDIKYTLLKFALPLLFTVTTFILFVLSINHWKTFHPGYENNFFLLLSAMIFTTLMINVSMSFVIANHINKNKYNLVSFVASTIVSLSFAGYFYSIAPTSSTQLIFGYMGLYGSYLILFLAFNIISLILPILRAGSIVQKNFITSYLINGITTAFISVILILGLQLPTIFASRLFSLYKDDGLFYTMFLWIPAIICYLVAPIIFLRLFITDLDKAFENTSQLVTIGKKIIQSIVILFSSLYTAIIFAYLLKILFTGEVPSNTLATISIIAIILNLITIFLSKLQTNKLSRAFCLILPIATFITIASYSYSIIIRISSYGFTVDRSLNLILILITIIVTSWLLISKRPNFAKMALVSSAILALSVLTPFVNIFHISEVSQIERIGNETNNLDISSMRSDLSTTSLYNNWYDTNYKNMGLAKDLIYLRDYHGLEGILNQTNWSDSDKEWFKDKVKNLHVYNRTLF